MDRENKDWSKLKKVLTTVVDILILNFSILVSYRLKFGSDIPDFNLDPYKAVYIYISIVFVILNILFGVYVYYNKSIGDIIVITLIIQSLFTVFLMAITFFLRGLSLPRSVIVYSLVISILLLIVWRIITYKLYVRVSGSKKIIVLGNYNDVLEAYQNISASKNQRHKIISLIVSNFYENLKSEIDQGDIVYIASEISTEEKTLISDYTIRSNKKLFLKADFPNLLLINPNVMNIEDESVIEVSDFKIPAEDDVVKRFFDIVLSLVLLIVTSPITLITALLIKVTAPGPIFYSQVRITKDQREFKILKFRTMVVTAEKNVGPVLASSNDNRVTPIGNYLRSFRIDEIPQLINVLKGDMSIVGPRPERPFFVDQFNEENSSYYLRHKVRAGITGYAQVYGKYASNFNNKLKFDLLYIKKYSLILDVKIMFQTIKILFDKVSSGGVEENQEEMTFEQLRHLNIKIYE